MGKANKKASSPVQVLKESGMTSILIPIEYCDSEYLSTKQERYTGASRCLLARADEMADPNFIKFVKKKYSLTDIEYRTVKSDCIVKLDAFDDILDELSERTAELTEIINDSETESNIRFDAFNTRAKLLRVIKSGKMTYGGRKNMRVLSHLYNLLNNIDTEIAKTESELIKYRDEMNHLVNSDAYIKRRNHKIKVCEKNISRCSSRLDYLEKKKDTCPDDIKQVEKQMSSHRLLNMGILGEANQKGNRFIKSIEFDEILEGKYKKTVVTVILKITGEPEEKIVLKNLSRKKIGELKQIWNLAQQKKISLTCYMSKEYLVIQYDKMVANGIAIDKKSMKADYKQLKEDTSKTEEEKKEIRKQIFRYYNVEQEQRMLSAPLPNGKAKIPGRGIAFDLNPGEMGAVVYQRKKNNDIRIITAMRVSFDEDIKHLNEPSWSARSKTQTNCLHNDITLSLKRLFEMAAEYQCSECSREDLDFKIDLYTKYNPTESNYKNIHKWCRELTENTIHRRCVENGILDVVVNPAYSSFIGCIKHFNEFCDSVAAATEIARRGAYRFTNGSFYPDVTEKDITALHSAFENAPDVELCVDKKTFHKVLEDINTSMSWKEIYKSVKECFKKQADFEHRYRTNYKKSTQ